MKKEFVIILVLCPITVCMVLQDTRVESTEDQLSDEDIQMLEREEYKKGYEDVTKEPSSCHLYLTYQPKLVCVPDKMKKCRYVWMLIKKITCF